MKNLLIIGTGGFAREVWEHAHHSIGYGGEFLVGGFLEGTIPLNPLKYGNLPMRVLGNIENYQVKDNDAFVIAIANPAIKKKISEIIFNKNGRSINLIHKTSTIASSAILGYGVIICPYVFISCNTKIGNHVMFNCYSSLGHDAEVGQYSSIMGHVDITGQTKVGEYTFWGSGSRALPGSKIGDHSIIGAGSVVLRKVKPNTTVFGNPAIPIN